MKKYRKKPVVIEAVQFLSMDDIPKDLRGCGSYGIGESHLEEEFLIKTLEGTMKAQKGDWIIKGIKGEYYPCKPDIFEATYEEAQ